MSPVPAEEARPIRVAIVDDDLWVRTGRAAALGAISDIEVLATLDHADAMQHPGLCASVDVVLVDAYDGRAGFDRFPGASVVKAIRTHEAGSGVTVVIVTGHVANDVLRLRMAEVGADFFYGHEEVSDVASLAAVIRAASTSRSTASPPAADAARPDSAVAWIRERTYEEAFSGESQKALPVSRRTIMGIRRQIGGLMGRRGSSTSPTWRATRTFVDRARGADIDPPPEAGPR